MKVKIECDIYQNSIEICAAHSHTFIHKRVERTKLKVNRRKRGERKKFIRRNQKLVQQRQRRRAN